MPGHLRRVARAAMMAAPLGLSVAPAGESTRARMCSLESLAIARDTAGTHFVATALADTVLAGPGSVRPSDQEGHSGPAHARPVHGQLMRIDTLGGANSEAVRAAAARSGTRDVVVVPWDYDPGCMPTYWSPSARWVEPGLTGFYTVRARPTSEWVGGRPTFDAFAAALEPYPHRRIFLAGYDGTGAFRRRASLTPVEMFSLYQALPPQGARTASGDSADLAPLRAWAAAHPELAIKHPADRMLDAALRGIFK